MRTLAVAFTVAASSALLILVGCQAAPAPAAYPPGLSAANCQLPAAARSTAPVPAPVEALVAQGYLVVGVADFEVLSAVGSAAQAADGAVAASKGSYDVVANGTFYGGKDPVGPIVRDGIRDTGGYAICAERGGLARLKDGTIVVARTCGGAAAQLAAAFGATPANPVEEAMGGGALLIEHGEAVSDADLRDRQNFKQGQGGIQAAQMRKTTHSLMGIRDGLAFHVWAKNKSGAEIQRELAAAGFTALVMLDGGSAGSYDDGATVVTARSPALTGLGITAR